VKSHFGPFGDSLSVGAWFAPNIPEAQKSFRTHPMELWVMWVMWHVVSVRLGIVLVSVQDRCTVCAKHIIGLEIILDAPDGTSRPCGSCGISFRSVYRQC
jgi:hypothetical protein